MQLNAKETTIIKSLLKIVKFVDGDGIILEDIVSKKELEVRLYGIDAPEINYCKKIKKDEIELQVPAALLIKLGYLSFNFLKDQVNLGDVCTLVQEQNNLVDKYGRLLGYLQSRTMKYFVKCFQCIKNGIYKLKTVQKDYIR